VLRQRLESFWERWLVPINLRQVLLAAVMIVAGDEIYDQIDRHDYSGPFDWTAHLGTSLLILNLFPQRWRRPILAPALLFSVVIDADHIPSEFFHSPVLYDGTPRPFTHSWVTPGAALLIALLWPKYRTFFIGAAVGLCLHFFRDLAEEPGNGVALFWPATRHAYHYSHPLYFEIMAVIFTLNLLRLALARGGPIQAKPWPPPGSQPAR
jgi:membrane-bound metal-dependent hydrolase YbcI (DUF457 family)